MARLKEADIRRIIREESERGKRDSEVTEEAHKTLRRLNSKRALGTKTGGLASSDTAVRDIHWEHFVQQVIDTYWEVVEEEMNE